MLQLHNKPFSPYEKSKLSVFRHILDRLMPAEGQARATAKTFLGLLGAGDNGVNDLL